MSKHPEYYDLRRKIARAIPRVRPLGLETGRLGIKEKGRKSGYKETKITKGEMVPQSRLLNQEEINNFIEVSCRAHACPMPVNLDVWDGLRCPYGCKYCFADNFRASLYTAFFDNSKSLGVRHCNADLYKRELEKLMKFREMDPHKLTGIPKAIAMGIPLRFGIRFEDFGPQEAEAGTSLELIRFLGELDYPVMINTKSDLIGTQPYIEALANNGGGAAVHITIISSDNKLLKQIEPNAPSFEARVGALKALEAAGVRTVARIEPYLVFLTDREEDMAHYIREVKAAGTEHITLDTYSYSAKNPGIRREFQRMGIDYDRMFLLGCDSQAIGSLLLGSFMDMFRKDFQCSTFDMGNVPDNNDDICCEVGDLFEGFNWGCTVMAARFIQRAKRPVGWSEFEEWVNTKGGFLSETLRLTVWGQWNNEGTMAAYGQSWAKGMVPVGRDENGMIWSMDGSDYRKELLAGLML